MRRIALVLLGVVVLLVVASQLLLPPLAERRVADRLERGGGSATVSISAFPALRLLLGHGDSLEVRGRSLRLEPGARGVALDRLDRFGEVRIRLTGATIGPLRVRSFSLTKPEGVRDYDVVVAATTSPREVATYLGSRVAGGLGGTLGGLAAGTVPGSTTPIPLDLAARLGSRHGERRVVVARGSVAGIPADPIVELAVDGVARRL